MHAASVPPLKKGRVMKIRVHDNVKPSPENRHESLLAQVQEAMSRFEHSIHEVEVTLKQDGHDGTALAHCHVTACLGPLGVVVSDWRDSNEHQAFKGALARLLRGISRRIEKRRTRRQHAEPVRLAMSDG